jgi:hypothetical protein
MLLLRGRFTRIRNVSNATAFDLRISVFGCAAGVSGHKPNAPRSPAEKTLESAPNRGRISRVQQEHQKPGYLLFEMQFEPNFGIRRV